MHQSKVCNTSGAMDGSRSHLPPQFPGWEWTSKQALQWSLFAKLDDGYGPIWHILNGLLDAFKILPFYGKYSSQILKHFRGNRWFSLCNIISFVRLRVPPKYMVCVSGTYFLGRYGPIYLILDQTVPPKASLFYYAHPITVLQHFRSNGWPYLPTIITVFRLRVDPPKAGISAVLWQ